MDIFDNPDEHRIRAGWRLLLQVVILMFLLFASYLIFQGIFSEQIMLIWTSAVVTLSVWIAAKALDIRKLKEYGLVLNGAWFRHLAAGFVLGAVAMAIIFLIFLSLGWIELLGFGWERNQNGRFFLALFTYFLAMCSVGYYEELWTRGYQTKNLAEGLHFARVRPEYAVAAAIILTSVLFGILHAGNPHATVLSTLVITLAGIMFAIPYVITGQLGLPVGLHISWNFFQGGVFGFPVSGLSTRTSILQIRTTGPELWTGGLFGPEAGLSGLITVVFLIGLIVVYLKRSGFPMRPVSGFTEWKKSPSYKKNRDH